MKTKNRKKLLLPIIILAFLPAINGQSMQKYPYVADGGANGPVIVSRDDKGGVHPDALTSIDNRIAYGFQVDNTDKGAMDWTTAQSACTDGWRLPNKRELQLIWLTGGAKSEQYGTNVGRPIGNKQLNSWGDGFQPLTADEYWSSNVGGWYVSFKDGKVANDTSGSSKVRCVRDYDTVWGEGVAYTTSAKNSILNIAPSLANNGLKMEWTDIKQGITCPYPYHTPTQTEMQLVYIERAGFTTAEEVENNYWTSTQSNDDNAWSVSGSGKTYDEDKSLKYRVRCVISNTADAKKYPYVYNDGDAAIIVSIDEDGGVNPEVLRPNGYANLNGIAAKFQVRNEDLPSSYWEDAKKSCTDLGDDWRLPTQREMMLVWLMGGGAETAYNKTGPRATANHLTGSTPLYSFTDFFTPLMEKYWTLSPGGSLACNVRFDIGYISTSPDAIYGVRCVKTIE